MRTQVQYRYRTAVAVPVQCIVVQCIEALCRVMLMVRQLMDPDWVLPAETTDVFSVSLLESTMFYPGALSLVS